MRILCLLLLATTAFCYQTENVFIINIDGMRWQDGPALGSSRMPYLWDSLRPHGTLYTNFMDRSITVTNSGHSTITTGVRQLLQNNSGCISPIRPREPTIGEYFRKYGGATQAQAVFVSGKNTIWRYPVSTYPGFGYEVAPTIVYGSGQDTVTWDSLRAVVARLHPKLSYTIFAHVDGAGHTADTAQYLRAISYVDSIIYVFWQMLQGDSLYRNRTTMIVTDDHGRHDDAHGGWQGHGDWCRGCRHVLFFAIGPDIKADTVIDLARDQIDIAPTVGLLLNFRTPLAQGEVMSEMIRDYQDDLPGNASASRLDEVNLSNSAGFSRSCDIAEDAQGLHVVYSDCSRGAYEVYYTRSSNQGATWSLPTVLFPYSEGTAYTEPVITAVGDSGSAGLYAAAVGYRYVATDTTCVWMLSGRRSSNSGLTWDALADIDTLNSITCRPAIAADGWRMNIITNRKNRLWSNLSRDGGVSFDSARTVTKAGKHHPQWPAATIVDTTCYVVWQDCYADTLHPFHSVWFDHEAWAAKDTPLTRNTVNSFSYQPSIVSDGRNRLHLAYCDLPDASAGNLWRIAYQQGTSLGDTWSAPGFLSGGQVGYQPAIRLAGNGNLYCVWAAHDAGLWHLAGSVSLDTGLSWSTPFAITEDREFSVEPRLAVSGDTLYVVWQDARTGNWEIFFTSYVLPQSGLETGHRETARARLGIFPNPSGGRVTFQVPSGFGRAAQEMRIYSAAGELVRTIVIPRFKNLVNQPVIWDGRDNLGRALASGVYSVILNDGQGLVRERFVLLSQE